MLILGAQYEGVDSIASGWGRTTVFGELSNVLKVFIFSIISVKLFLRFEAVLLVSRTLPFQNNLYISKFFANDNIEKAGTALVLDAIVLAIFHIFMYTSGSYSKVYVK